MRFTNQAMFFAGTNWAFCGQDPSVIVAIYWRPVAKLDAHAKLIIDKNI